MTVLSEERNVSPDFTQHGERLPQDLQIGALAIQLVGLEDARQSDYTLQPALNQLNLPAQVTLLKFGLPEADSGATLGALEAKDGPFPAVVNYIDDRYVHAVASETGQSTIYSREPLLIAGEKQEKIDGKRLRTPKFLRVASITLADGTITI